MAREMYLAGVSPEELKPTPQLEPPRTPREKWENFWYHYKWLFLGCLFGVIALAVIVGSSLSVNRPDYQVLLVTKSAYLDTDLDPLEEELAAYGRDLDGDGEVEVQILHCYMGEPGSSENLANSQALQAHLVAGDVMLYIWDPANYATFMDNIRNTASEDYAFLTPLSFGSEEDPGVWNWKDSDRHKTVDKRSDAAIREYVAMNYMPDDLLFGVRAATEVVEGSTGLQAEALELLTAFATGEKPAVLPDVAE